MIQNRTPINFLLHVFDRDVATIACIVVADGEDDYDFILNMFNDLRDTIELWKKDIEKERDEQNKEA